MALSQDLVRYYHTRMEPLEVLYHQVVADPETARREFERQFPEAEERYDLTACDALVRAVDRRSVDGESGDLRDTRAAWLRARGMWIEDYFRTARFVERPTLANELERLLRPEGGHRAIQLHAAGGFGKTQFIRWVLARYSRDHRVPCAGSTSTKPDAAKLAAEPVTLALILARQYDRQFPRAPFENVLKRLDLAPDRRDKTLLDDFARVLHETLSKSAGRGRHSGSGHTRRSSPPHRHAGAARPARPGRRTVGRLPAAAAGAVRPVRPEGTAGDRSEGHPGAKLFPEDVLINCPVPRHGARGPNVPHHVERTVRQLRGRETGSRPFSNGRKGFR